MFALSRPARAVLALGAACLFGSAVASATALAQKDKGKDAKGAASGQCSIDFNSPQDILSSNLYLNKAKSATDTAEKTKNYQAIVAALGGKNYKTNNPAARDYILGQADAYFLSRPGANPVGTRGSFGFKDDPSAQVDLLATLATLATALGT